MGKYDEAMTCFRQALSILDQIREDTGIARERVMEKLSETTEALQTLKGREGVLESPQSTGEEDMQQRDAIRSKLHSIASTSEEYAQRPRMRSRSKSLSSGEELLKSRRTRNRAGSLSIIVGDADKRGYSLPGLNTTLTAEPTSEKKISLTERRGVKTLPPIRAKGSELGTRKHAVLASRKGKQKMHHSEPESGEASDYSADLHAYVNSYMDSSNTASISSWSQDVQRQLSGLPAAPPGTRTVREGSLAIGENARDTFTVQNIQEWGQGRGGKKKQRTRSQIIQMAASPAISTSNSEPNERQRPIPTSQPTKSKICNIL